MSHVQTIDPTLRRRTQKLLQELSLLSYAPTQAWKTEAAGLKRDRIACPSCQGRGNVLKGDWGVNYRGCSRCRGRGTVVSTAAPHGSKQKHHESATPPYCDSLYEKFIGPVSHAFHNEDSERLESLCVAMETEIAHYRGQYRAEITLPPDEEAAMKKVVEVFEGADPVEVSRRLASKVSPGWVEKARKLHRRDNEGHKLPHWRGWSDEERRAKVEHAVKQGWSMQRTAREYAAPSSTLHDTYGHFWERRAA